MRKVNMRIRLRIVPGPMSFLCVRLLERSDDKIFGATKRLHEVLLHLVLSSEIEFVGNDRLIIGRWRWDGRRHTSGRRGGCLGLIDGVYSFPRWRGISLRTHAFLGGLIYEGRLGCWRPTITLSGQLRNEEDGAT